MTTSPPLASQLVPALELPPQPLRHKHLPPRLPSAPPDLVPARMINETLYCERLVYLEWVQGEFQDSFFTVEGRSVHRRADQPSGKMPPKAKPKDPAEDDDESANPEAPPYTARSVWLSSDSLGITAKIDIVEGSDDGVVIPIEYKRGSPPEVAERGDAPLEWLAFRGLPLLPSFPRGSRIITTGVVGRGGDMTFSWPLWSVPASLPTTRSALQVDWTGNTKERAARGIFAMCSSAIRRTSQGFGNFGPSSVMS